MAKPQARSQRLCDPERIIAERLESDSTDYPTFVDFYPGLLRVLETRQRYSGKE